MEDVKKPAAKPAPKIEKEPEAPKVVYMIKNGVSRILRGEIKDWEADGWKVRK